MRTRDKLAAELRKVDEATGYQDFRQRDALAKILEKFVAKELRPWVKTFPAEFYKLIFRLNGWSYTENTGRPGVIGHWTNNIIYKRLAPGVWEELKRVTPRTPSGSYQNKLFQRLTEHVGHPKLREHMSAALMLMKYSPHRKYSWTGLTESFRNGALIFFCRSPRIIPRRVYRRRLTLLTDKMKEAAH